MMARWSSNLKIFTTMKKLIGFWENMCCCRPIMWHGASHSSRKCALWRREIQRQHRGVRWLGMKQILTNNRNRQLQEQAKAVATLLDMYMKKSIQFQRRDAYTNVVNVEATVIMLKIRHVHSMANQISRNSNVSLAVLILQERDEAYKAFMLSYLCSCCWRYFVHKFN